MGWEWFFCTSARGSNGTNEKGNEGNQEDEKQLKLLTAHCSLLTGSKKKDRTPQRMQVVRQVNYINKDRLNEAQRSKLKKKKARQANGHLLSPIHHYIAILITLRSGV